MEIIGKGNHSRGAVWVATRIPDGAICAHANQARTQDFIVGDPERFRYSPDVVDFARELGLYQGPDEDFSFPAAYDPVTVYGARTCEARVFSIFSRVAAPEEHMEQYIDYVMGRNIHKHMPLYVKGSRKFTVNDTFWLMRDHYETTFLDSSSDISGGNWRSPIQLGSEGSVWEFEGKRYINERPVGVPFTHFNMVANQRPQERFGVLWFGVDDSTFTVRAPFYGVATRFPAAWDDSNCTSRDACREQAGLPGTIQKFSLDSMFWVTNMVANFAYSRYDEISLAVFDRLARTESRLQAAVKAQDLMMAALPEATAREAATDFSFATAAALHKEWLDFYGELFVKYVDGYTMHPGSGGTFKKIGSQLRPLLQTEIALQTGSKYQLPGPASASDGTNMAAVIDKRQLRSLGQQHSTHFEDVFGQQHSTHFEDVHAAPGFGERFHNFAHRLLTEPASFAVFAVFLAAGSFSLGVSVARPRKAVRVGSLLEPFNVV